MPIGYLTDCFLVLLGGLMGTVLGTHLSPRVQKNLTVILGFCSMAIGINSITKVVNMTPVVVSVILGTLLGEMLDLESRITSLFGGILHRLSRKEAAVDMERFITVVVLFCASGFGIYGILMEGMSGEASILLSKSVLDFCTAAVFAVTLGLPVVLVVAPMAIVMGGLLLLAGLLAPYVNPVMLQDFMACGGILTLAAGLRVSGIKNYPLANMIPALALVLPGSVLWMML